MILQSSSPQPTSSPTNCFANSFLAPHLIKNFKISCFYNFNKRAKISEHESYNFYCLKSLSTNSKIRVLETEATEVSFSRFPDNAPKVFKHYQLLEFFHFHFAIVVYHKWLIGNSCSRCYTKSEYCDPIELFFSWNGDSCSRRYIIRKHFRWQWIK